MHPELVLACTPHLLQENEHENENDVGSIASVYISIAKVVAFTIC